MRIPVTKEQKDIGVQAKKGANLGIIAGPGSGKSTTLRYVCGLLNDMGKTGLYLVYTKEIANDMIRIMGEEGVSGEKIKVSTFHSLAWKGTVSSGVVNRDRIGNISTRDISRFLGTLNYIKMLPEVSQISEIGLTPTEANPFVLNSGSIMSLIKTGLENFLQSSESDPNIDHINLDDHILGIRMLLQTRAATNPDPISRFLLENAIENEKGNIKDTKRQILGYVQQIWEDIKNPRGTIVIPHDAYLKLYIEGLISGRITLPQVDYILVDEFQDANPSILSLVKIFVENNKQVISVGDPNQHIFGFSNNVNGFGFGLFDHHMPLTKSFRFGNEIAEPVQEFARKVMGINGYILTGNEAIQSCIDDPKFTPGCSGLPFRYDAILCRTTAGVLEQILSPEFYTSRGEYIGPYAPKTPVLLQLATDIFSLAEDKPAVGPLKMLGNSAELEEYLVSEGRHMTGLIKNLVKIPKTSVISRLNAASDPSHRARGVILTAHSSKGLEFGSVKIANGFSAVLSSIESQRNGKKTELSDQKDLDRQKQQELNLLFVALTRAKHVLNPYTEKNLIGVLPPESKGVRTNAVYQKIAVETKRPQKSKKEKGGAKKKVVPLPFNANESKIHTATKKHKKETHGLQQNSIVFTGTMQGVER
jgi:energy-coupling factor transporter ATP-binding protein EcfA2